MGKDSKIEWTHHTFNPWIGCVKVSDGCKHCYAEAQNKRWGRDLWGVDRPRQVTSDAYWKQPYAWNAEAEQTGERRRVFCASMADVFEDRDDLIEQRIRLFNLISYTPSLDWLLLTKRPQNIMPLVGRCWGYAPLPSNVWLGTSVENQKAADERIPYLLKVPAVVRFLSCEPLLGAVDLSSLMFIDKQCPNWEIEGVPPIIDPETGVRECCRHCDWTGIVSEPAIDWVIAGGESGPGARPMHPDWVRGLRDECVNAGIPFHFKQWGEYALTEERTMHPHEDCAFSFGNPKREIAMLNGLRAARMERVGKHKSGRFLDGREWNEAPKL